MAGSVKTHSIAIIGGGFSGAALAATLLRHGLRGLDVHVVEPRPLLGRGIAYGDADRGHILNVVAGRMSLWSDRPGDFLDWARRHGPSLGWPEAAAAGEHTYLPRRLFGHYVSERLEEAAAAGAPNLIRTRAKARRILAAPGGFHLDLDDGTSLFAHQVVLATGFQAPALPFPVEGRPARVVSDPWGVNALSFIDRDDDVLVVGTGLTMVDVVSNLHRAGHRGTVTAVSRHGLLPLAHGFSEDIAPLLSTEDAAAGVLHSLRAFRAAIRRGEADWRAAMDGLRPVIDLLWQSLPPTEQDRFLRHVKPFWEIHRHRVPAESADLLLHKVARGRLILEAARIQSVTADETGVAVSLRPRGSNRIERRHVHWLINCTPPAPPLKAPAQSLYRALLADGLARPDRTGMGIDVDGLGRPLDRSGQPVAGLYTIGPLRKGTSIETTAVPHIRPQLDALAPLLLGLPTSRLAAE
jgi:uncharacterized NAD(P)/FAD-binding protein YdhS